MSYLMGGGRTVLFVSYSLSQIQEMCSRVIWLEHGHLKIIGDTETICSAYENA